MHPVIQAYRESVGRRIREARITAGLSHDRLAEKVGTSRQHLIKLEKGQHLARPEMLARIAEATDRSVEFFEGDDEEEAARVGLTGVQRELLADFADALATLTRSAAMKPRAERSTSPRGAPGSRRKDVTPC